MDEEEEECGGATQTYDDALLDHWASLTFTPDGKEINLNPGVTRIGRDAKAEISIPSKVLSRCFTFPFVTLESRFHPRFM